jgi:hypothetical protein
MMIVPHGDQRLGASADGSLTLFQASVVGDNMAAITIPMDLDVTTGKEHAPETPASESRSLTLRVQLHSNRVTPRKALPVPMFKMLLRKFRKVRSARQVDARKLWSTTAESGARNLQSIIWI